MNISLRTIPHKSQLYPTVGNWIIYPNGELEILVSDLGDWRYDLLVAVHELVEASLCIHRGIKQKDVDAFDIAFERDRDPGDESEPGDSPKAPYRNEHRFAENIERQLALALDVDWQEYEHVIQML